jgi:hypothetical protein
MTANGLFAVFLCVLPAWAAADDLERFETASEQMTVNLNAFYLARLPEVGDKLTPPDWTDVERAIGQCFLDRLREEEGTGAVDLFLGEIEGLAQIEITTYATYVEILTFPLFKGAGFAVSSECGLMDRTVMRDLESGIYQVLSDPANQQRLAAD